MSEVGISYMMLHVHIPLEVRAFIYSSDEEAFAFAHITALFIRLQ